MRGRKRGEAGECGLRREEHESHHFIELCCKIGISTKGNANDQQHSSIDVLEKCISFITMKSHFSANIHLDGIQ
jgi:hypothetical protein